MSPVLVPPCAAHKESYRDLVKEFADRGEPPIPFTLAIPHENFEAFLAQLAAASRGEGIPAGFVANSTYFLVDAGEVMGVSNLRHTLTDKLRREGGHIGYGIRPSVRGRGLGTEILRLMLREAGRRGIDRALLTCSKSNVASSRVIQGNGGVLDSEEFSPERGEVLQRWWIEVAPGA